LSTERFYSREEINAFYKVINRDGKRLQFHRPHC